MRRDRRRGRSPSATGAPCRRRPSVPGAATRRLLRPVRTRCSYEPSSTAWRRAAPTRLRWKAPRVSPARRRRIRAAGRAVRSSSKALNQTPPIVEIRNLGYAVSSRAVFAGLDLDIARGRVTAIMGPSGTGKTTLLRLITGQARADSGSIHVGGTDMRTVRRADLYVLRRRMGMLFQNGALLTDLSVFENVAFPLREHTDLPERLIRQLVLTKLQAVGLRGAADLMPSELSGGMSRRVALARAIVMDPEILIYDEPFVGLDPISLGVILRLVRRLNDTLGLSSIVVSHDVQAVSQIADVLCLLAQGKIVACGTPEELRVNRSDTVRQFMEGNVEGPVPFHHSAPEHFDELLAGPVSGKP